jgi:hypothetical protein
VTAPAFLTSFYNPIILVAPASTARRSRTETNLMFAMTLSVNDPAALYSYRGDSVTVLIRLSQRGPACLLTVT